MQYGQKNNPGQNQKLLDLKTSMLSIKITCLNETEMIWEKNKKTASRIPLRQKKSIKNKYT